MARTLTIGNGNLLVGIDSRAQVRDFFFPFAGHSNHVSGASGSYKHRIGVWADGVLKWLSDDSWNVTTLSGAESVAHTFIARNELLGITLTIVDAVHNEHNIFLRSIQVTDDWERVRTIKLFFAQEFRISESRRGDTAFYDPRVGSIIHYKGHETFLVHALIDGESFSEYTVGLFGIEGKEGSYMDAEDGILSHNPIEHGSVDSTIGVTFESRGKSTALVQYWITAGDSIHEAHVLHKEVLTERPLNLIESTTEYWHAWVNKETRDFSPIEKSLQHLYEQSLIIIRVHADNRGGIIASSDTDVLNQGRDTYSYVWPRDASISAHALDRAGYFDIAARFFGFISKRSEHDGYLMHKYRVDGVLGSSWHPWLRDGMFELPIQEDETALPVFMLARHYARAKDLEFLESLYNPFVEPLSEFMCGYIDGETELPASSYDLWEEKFGMSTYTASAVYGALLASAEMSALLGKRENAEKYRARAERIKHAILTHLYDASTKTFIKLVYEKNGKLLRDTTLDLSSLHGILSFGVLDPSDARVKSMVSAIEERLKVPTQFGGYMRYEGDAYYKTAESAPPNAWCITTLWMAQYYIRVAHSKKELQRAYDMLLWIRDRATVSGMLPEQIHPYTGEHLSTSPLVWSHAEYVITIDEYIKKYKSL
jgi:GH15 family glucan-1,4-alpha-glucosidase